jgi:putative Mg2+ transporter-C (MgtC) family protein
VKSAGIRTHTLVGVGSAVFTLVSWYGFAEAGHGPAQDPSRIAAQVVSGIGFLGGGVIFVRQNVVSGLTTAASIWVTAAVGMACGAGMPALAIVTTGLHLAAVLLLAPLSRLIPSVVSEPEVVIRYRDGAGLMRNILGISRELGYETTLLEASRVEVGPVAAVEARFRFTRGNAPLDKLIERLSEVRGVESVAPPGEDHD